MNYLKRFTSIPTKDFFIKNTLIRVNKFGVHKIIKEDSLNTKLGYTHSIYKNETYDHAEFTNLIKNLNDYEIIKQYIESKKQLDNQVANSRIKIAIHNHAFPVIKIYEKSKLVVNDKIKWSHADLINMRISPIKTPQLITNPIYMDTLPKYKIESMKLDLGTIEVPGNEYNFVFDNSNENFNRDFGFYFTDKNVNVAEENIETTIEFLPYAPGGISNIGEPKDGKKQEIWFESGTTYELDIHISPGIKPKTSIVGTNRRFDAYYPYLPQEDSRFDKIIQKFKTDMSVSIPKADSQLTILEICNKSKFDEEEYFGINFDWKIKK